MSELTREKIYKKELIERGATGNNNLERIRSMSGSSELQEKTVIPTTTQQIIEADEGYDGLSSVFVEGVTSSIDSNIQPQNIVSGTSILGVAGVVQPSEMVREFSTNKLPVALKEVAAAKTDSNTIYIFGGATSDSNNSVVDTIYKYDLTTNQVTILNATLPVPTRSVLAIPYGDRIYLVGGQISTGGGTASFCYFDTTTETIATLQDASAMGIYRTYGIYGDKIYLVANAKIKTLDLATGTITEIISTGATDRAFFVTNEENIYIFGYDTVPSPKAYKFNMKTETLSSIPVSYNMNFYYASAISIGDYIYIFGGRNLTDENVRKQILKYNAKTNSFTNLTSDTLNFDKQLDSTAAVAVGNEMYIIGGIKYLQSTQTTSKNISKFKLSF